MIYMVVANGFDDGFVLAFVGGALVSDPASIERVAEELVDVAATQGAGAAHASDFRLADLGREVQLVGLGLYRSGRAGPQLEQGRPSGHHQSMLRLHGKSSPFRVFDRGGPRDRRHSGQRCRRGLDQGGEATRRRLKPPRLFGVSPGGQLNQDRDVRILLRSPAIILFGTFVSIRVTAAAQN